MMFTNKKILLILSFTSKPDFWMIEEYRRLGYEVEILVNEHATSSDLFKKRGVWGQAINSFARFMLGWKAHKRYAGESRVIFWNSFFC